ncbi:uncharacterized protein TNCV_1733731 [Trichonephila clavipes]|nr:uncharacterized protein TNCV_1733731 [Trichonephila clavipes]
MSSKQSRCTFIWIEPGTHNRFTNAQEIDHYDNGGLTTWAGITLDGRTHLHVFERGTATAVRHSDEVLEPYVSLFTGADGPDFILMEAQGT